MSEYQRFVSYLYEYRDNKKSKNCGFSRVEVRNHLCKLEVHMKLPISPFTPSFLVYAFVPTAGQLLGILLGKAACHQGSVYAAFTLPDREIGDSPYHLNDLGGLLIHSDDGRIFATAWKEIPVQPDHFFLPEAVPQIQAASLTESQSPEDEIATKEPFVENPDDENVRRYPLESPPENLVDSNVPTDPEHISADSAQAESFTQDDKSADYPDAESSAQNSVQNIDETLLPPVQTLSKSSQELSPDTTQDSSAQLDVHSAPDLPDDFPDAPSETVSAHRWQEIRESYPHTQPFFDDEIHECVKLSLKDIPNLARYDLYIGSNQFLTHGCQTFHHFLLGKSENGRPEEYVLAVPGVYDEKERFLAAMFGFPNFKPSRNKTIRPGQFGYWYRMIY